ncbi:hypothetical protein [Desulforamulus aquiferis]|uniref:Uncharacterized protein n=1 Tax=Desulforamulus aquiferis TaxID=1397668 RepID=A0AAW7ZEC1_9FIRM|nr:hypothetical protein [Desulforamulus aquiferis]MDO7788063.1 hypothetical protein [Desulforamulus aquiferis]
MFIINKPVCSQCQKEMVMIMSEESLNQEPQIFALNELIRKDDGTYEVNQERGLPVVIILCESCGYIMQYSAHKMKMG